MDIRGVLQGCVHSGQSLHQPGTGTPPFGPHMGIQLSTVAHIISGSHICWVSSTFYTRSTTRWTMHLPVPPLGHYLGIQLPTVAHIIHGSHICRGSTYYISLGLEPHNSAHIWTFNSTQCHNLGPTCSVFLFLFVHFSFSFMHKWI